MERNEIKGYIIKQKEGGMREKEIVEELLKQGRQKKEIDDVLLDMDLSSFGPETQTIHKSLFFVLLIAWFILYSSTLIINSGNIESFIISYPVLFLIFYTILTYRVNKKLEIKGIKCFFHISVFFIVFATSLLSFVLVILSTIAVMGTIGRGPG